MPREYCFMDGLLVTLSALNQFSEQPVPYHDFCGLDFGTSNSTIGIFDDNKITMVPLEKGSPTLRSAIFFNYDTDRCVFGQTGISEYLSEGNGRLMMSLKSILGSSLMEEKTLINKTWISYTDILACLLRYIKNQAEKLKGTELTRVVLGRPVRFHDYDDKRDRLAQDTLEAAAKSVGFETVLFQYEPIAAALAYEQTIDREQLALIVDLGGGTADYSVIRLRTKTGEGSRKEDVLANKGIHIGGTNFDTRFSLDLVMPKLGLGDKMHGISNIIEIPSSYFHDLTTWHTINSLYTAQVLRDLRAIHNYAIDPKPIERFIQVVKKQEGHKILNEVEQAKCKLSENMNTLINLDFIESNFSIQAEQHQFQASIQDLVDQLIQTLESTVREAGLINNNINYIFFTGGTSQVPIIRQRIKEIFPDAHMIRGDAFSSVGQGLILEAKRRFSC